MGRLHETGESSVANLQETDTWESAIYQLETVDPVQGGADGIDNLQAKQLANRTTYLKAFIEAVLAAQSGHEVAADPHAQYVTKAGDTMTGALDIQGDVYINNTLTLGTNSANATTDLQFTDNPNIAATSSMRFYTDSDNTGTGTVFDWLTNGGNITDGEPLMRLYDSGELLIGYTVDQGAYKLQVNGAAYFAGDLWTHVSAGRTDVIVDADSGYDSWINLREAGVDSLLIKNDASASEASIEKLNSAGITTVGAITFDESGGIDVTTGTLKQAGVEVATLQSLLDGVGLGKSLGANGYATLPGGLIIQWGLTTTLTSEGSQTITLPIVWPNGGFIAHATPIRSNPTANATVAAGATLVGTNQITVVLDHYNSAAASGIYWIAIGW